MNELIERNFKKNLSSKQKQKQNSHFQMKGIGSCFEKPSFKFFQKDVTSSQWRIHLEKS